ncbi:MULTISPECIES: acyltransferase [Actinosynnema]|uniref:acyltransferase family protein n=1 Tax=Actinosynnema TaxID=40566 RepID=UPI0020A26077|nr:acyltransferase [Actinosynnema pretiosum]MCP2096441.1 Peptidoglycan/LPS O-acetylase OafA/YrhL, contains acyltransferase and SGNH-hydrolase domains [Actinosynnema pretiosum]
MTADGVGAGAGRGRTGLAAGSGAARGGVGPDAVRLSGKGIRSLIGFRVLPAAGVLAGHLAPFAAVMVPATAGAWQAVDRVNYLAVDVFFVLSGFGIALGRAEAGRGHGRFLWTRLARLWPLHAVVLAGLAVGAVLSDVLGLGFERGGTWADFVAQALLLHGWGFADSLSWNGPTWSLSAELACYLAFPVIWALVRRVSGAAAAWCWHVVALLVVFGAYGVLGVDDAHLTYLAPLWRAFGDFTAGALLSRVHLAGGRVPELLGRWALPLVAGVFALVPVLALVGAPPLWALALVGPAVLGVAQEGALVRRVFRGPVALRLGRYSFAVFVVQVPCLLALSPFVGGALGVVAVVAAVLVVAVVCHHAVEAPCQRALRGLWG